MVSTGRLRVLRLARFLFWSPINRLSAFLLELIPLLPELIQHRFVNFRCAASDAVDLVISRA